MLRPCLRRFERAVSSSASMEVSPMDWLTVCVTVLLSVSFSSSFASWWVNNLSYLVFQISGESVYNSGQNVELCYIILTMFRCEDIFQLENMEDVFRLSLTLAVKPFALFQPILNYLSISPAHSVSTKLCCMLFLW